MPRPHNATYQWLAQWCLREAPVQDEAAASTTPLSTTQSRRIRQVLDKRARHSTPRGRRLVLPPA